LELTPGTEIWNPLSKDVLVEALDRMWAQFLPLMEERVSLLEQAATAFSANKLSTQQHQAATTAAHKLAGVLGTFGLTKGTVLARELEIMYSREGGPERSLAPRLTAVAAELRTIIGSRK
jgi:HPt (histidine-containing phosphotransfer) domain-containing protein